MSLLFASLDPAATGVQKVRWHCAQSRSWETGDEIARACGISWDAAHAAIQKLIKDRVMEREYPDRKLGRFTTKQRYRFRVQKQDNFAQL
jgi:predicted ArsR family transcriptional regulator